MSYPFALRIISDCWIVFCVIWLLASFWTKQSVYRERGKNLLRYILPLAIGAYLIFNGPRLSGSLGLRIIPHADIFARTSVILCVAGLAFCVWARFTLGRNWSGVITFKGDHELITRGPYAIVRHPIYTGLLIMLVGTVILYGRIAGIVALPFVLWGLWVKLRFEEQLMLKNFPDQYGAYQKRVKRIIPFIL